MKKLPFEETNPRVHRLYEKRNQIEDLFQCHLSVTAYPPRCEWEWNPCCHGFKRRHKFFTHRKYQKSKKHNRTTIRYRKDQV